jgi:RNA binding exosome subunit
MNEVSKNDNVKLGSHVYHVQTEYYRSSNKIVSNIFMDGKIVKRIESKPVEGEDIGKRASQQHEEILKKLRKGGRTGEGIKLTDRERKELIELLNESLGIATAFIIEEEARRAKSKEELINLLLEQIGEEDRERLKEKLKNILKPKEKDEELKAFASKIEPILKDYFGIVTYMILEEAQRKANLKEFIEFIVSNLNDEEERKSLREKLTSLLEGETVNVNREEFLKRMSDYFGINTLSVFEDSYKTWKEKNAPIDELIEIICSHIDSDSERSRLRDSLKSI